MVDEWSQIDVFVGGVGVGLLIGALFAYWAIRAFTDGAREVFERRIRDAEMHPVEKGYQPQGDSGPKRPPPPPRPPASEDPGKVVKSG